MDAGPGDASNEQAGPPAPAAAAVEAAPAAEPVQAADEQRPEGEVDIAKQRKEEREKARTEYLANHPELQLIVKYFLSEVLSKKPSDVGSFARDMFTQREAIDQYIRNNSDKSS